MVHKMRLVDFAFKAIKNKEKDIELRHNEEKRRLINVGDIIEFEHIDTKEIIRVEVTNLYKYDTFEELFKQFDKKDLGYAEDEEANPGDMEEFYTKEEQDKYGVVGIKIKKL